MQRKDDEYRLVIENLTRVKQTEIDSLKMELESKTNDLMLQVNFRLFIEFTRE